MTARLRKLPPAELTPEQQSLYDSIAGGPRAQGRQLFALTDASGGLEGPFNAMLLSPTIGGALQSVGSAVRYGGALSDRAREIAILVVAYVWDSAFEVYAHEAVGQAAGLTPEEFAALRTGDYLSLDDENERLVASTTAALAVDSDLSDEAFTSARDVLGMATLFELTTLVGYYATLALQLRVFRVAPPS